MNPFRTLTGYALSTLAVASGLALGWAFYRGSERSGFPEGPALGDRADLPTEAGMYRPVGLPQERIEAWRKMEDASAHGGRPRDSILYHSRRAYDGAPPFIPHPTSDALPGPNCLSCHEQGGWVERFRAFAPITPHPGFSQCRQCHVPRHGAAPFVASGFERSAPGAAAPAYEGAPAPMPHGLQMRENCASCHVGPGAMPSIRTSHPERFQCMQCHAPQVREAGTFIRQAGGMQP
jgi:cytochrome c-type protein NapB